MLEVVVGGFAIGILYSLIKGSFFFWHLQPEQPRTEPRTILTLVNPRPIPISYSR